MKSQFRSTFPDIVNRQISASLRAPGLKTVEQIKGLFESARLVRTPPNTDVVIYYAGHGQQDTGNWVASERDQMGNHIKSIAVTLEQCLDVWISQPDKAQSLCLIILADCCYSGRWVTSLRDAEKYRGFPICIISACGEDEVTVENNLVPMLMGEKPNIRLQPQFWATKSAKNSWLYRRFTTNIKSACLIERACSQSSFPMTALLAVVAIAIVIAFVTK